MVCRGIALALLPLTASSVFSAQTVVARGGAAKTAVFVAPQVTPSERYAAEELARWLGKMTGTRIPIRSENAPVNAILVGDSPAARHLFPTVAWDYLQNEATVMRVSGGRTLLVGGGTRGTLYAVYGLLDRLGCRWWTPWATTIPHRRDLTLPKLNADSKPAFESRDAFWYPAFDGDWAARNRVNGQTARLEARHGGKVEYAGGFVHTFYPLVPPDPNFRLHPEWYALVNGKRTAENAQLCTTDPALRDSIVERVKGWLRANPRARIVSVSQNDCFNPCQCDRCQGLAKSEGSEAGPMIALANYVAERIEREFPEVAVDTLAYQYTRHAPKTIKPRPNVIVRLCSIECDFAHPLDAPTNASFAQDVRDWSRLTDRLYVWNYDTNFAHYPQPIPNWFILGPNERFFRANGVRGVFEQGSYQSNGGEMAELRAWVQSRLLWNPQQDDKAQIDEFLRGYYGPAAKSIRAYLDLMARAADADRATIYDPPTKPFFAFPTLAKAEALWQEAERRVGGQKDLLWRVRQGHGSLRYVWLSRWNDLRAEARRTGAPWPLPESRKTVADAWLALAIGPGPQGWTPMTHVNEGGLTPQAFAARFALDPAPLPARATHAPWPQDFDLQGRKVVDIQDEWARLINDPAWATLRADPLASDGIAARMPGDHHEWAFQLPLATARKELAKGRWRVLVVARTSGTAKDGPAFSVGVWDDAARRDLLSKTFPVGGDAYRTYDLGPLDLTPNALLWIAPPARKEVTDVWIDRVILVRA